MKINAEPEQIGERIRKIRKNKHLSQAELAERTGYSRNQISNIETGKFKDVGLGFIRRIADALDTDMEEILLYKEEKFLFADEDIDEAIAKRKIQEQFYTRTERQIQIQTLMDFLLYLPLIKMEKLTDVLVNRFQGEFFGCENYIIDKLEYLYQTIPNSKAKEYADHYRKIYLTEDAYAAYYGNDRKREKDFAEKVKKWKENDIMEAEYEAYTECLEKMDKLVKIFGNLKAYFEDITSEDMELAK